MAETIDITQLLKKFNVLEKDLENVKQKQLQTDILLHSSIARNIDLTFNKFVNIESRDIIALQTLVSQVYDVEVKKSLRSAFLSRIDEIQCILFESRAQCNVKRILNSNHFSVVVENSLYSANLIRFVGFRRFTISLKFSKVKTN